MKDRTLGIAQYRSHYLGTQPEYLHAPYASSVARAPQHAPVRIPQTLSEVTGPASAGQDTTRACDLTLASGGGEAQGQRIIVSGRVLDENARPVRNTLLEIWQANAAGRYLHRFDQHDAPLDPNFTGVGHTLTDDEGRYRFITIRPGSYPWGNHYNAWRPAHIHLSLFGPCVATRLVTQMYFPGDPMLEYDPIFNCTADPIARRNLISNLDWETTIPQQAIGYRFDIILRGRDATPMETNHR
ncbi:MAG TPA: protocatechuate 3,4-dioxygenase subunit beta [Acidobacteriaceae bacterium]|jgi:protocatechuate 3,4-dioxygenase beta subunit